MLSIAVETLGALECATDFFQNLGRPISVTNGELRSSQFLFQTLRCNPEENAVCVVGTVPGTCGLLYLIFVSLFM